MHSDRAHQYLQRYGAYGLAILFTASSFLLMSAKHNSFNTLVYDFARFTQAIWNTLEGRFLFETIKYGSILGNHFSPIMALAAPALHLFGTPRILFLIQAINVAVTGLLLHRLFREKQPDHPFLALAFLLAFYLNPAIHDITLSEVRRIVFGMPFLTLGLYGLATQRRGWMLMGWMMALLAKEDVGISVAMAGLYLLLVRRDVAWGVGLTLLGAIWAVGVSAWIIPSIGASDNSALVYPQLYYFDHLGGSYSEILATVLRSPLAVAQHMLGPQQLGAIGRLLLSLGLILPLLAPRWALMCVPHVALMFLSRDPRLAQLTKWYSTTIMPVLFSAIIVGWNSLPKHRWRWAMGWLLITTLIGYAGFSPAPLGGHYQPDLYRVTARDRIVRDLLSTVSQDLSVAAQHPYVAHLTLRQDIYHYPWIRIGEDQIDVFVLDRKADAYPLNHHEIAAVITKKVTNPDFIVAAEADGFYILSRATISWPAYPVDRTAEGTMHLDRVEVAIADADGVYRTTTQAPLKLQPGDQLRVSLYWKALAAPNAQRTVSVRVVGPTGSLIAQHDGWPGDASKPTIWWERGWHVRDVHYLTVAADAPPGNGSLDVLLYDSATIEIVSFAADDGAQYEHLQIVPVALP